MAFSQIPSSITIIQSGLIGYQAISLTEFTTSAASLIAAGSSVEIAGAYFKAGTDITPDASSLTAISSLTTCYLALTPSSTAGSQILTATWESAAPVWSDSKQGWYASAASNVRIVASMYKVASGNYISKFIYSGTPAGNLIRPYRATTESFSKTFSIASTFETLTTRSSVYTIIGGYVTYSGTPTIFRDLPLFASAGTLYSAIPEVTNATVIVNYCY